MPRSNKSRKPNKGKQAQIPRVPINATSYRGPLMFTNPIKNADNDTIVRTVLDIIPLGPVATQTVSSVQIPSFPATTGPDWIAFSALYSGFRSLAQKICWCPLGTCNNASAGVSDALLGLIVAQPSRNPIAPIFTSLADVDYSCFLRQVAGTMGEVLQYKMTGTLESEFQDTASPQSNWLSLVSHYTQGAPAAGTQTAGFVLVYTTVQFRGSN